MPVGTGGGGCREPWAVNGKTWVPVTAVPSNSCGLLVGSFLSPWASAFAPEDSGKEMARRVYVIVIPADQLCCDSCNEILDTSAGLLEIIQCEKRQDGRLLNVLFLSDILVSAL